MLTKAQPTQSSLSSIDRISSHVSLTLSVISLSIALLYISVSAYATSFKGKPVEKPNMPLVTR